MAESKTATHCSNFPTLVISGNFPIDEEVLRDACAAYHQRIEWEDPTP